MFDVVLETYFDSQGIRTAKVIKDRTNKLPEVFPLSYNEIVRYVDVQGLERKPEVFKQVKSMAEIAGRNFEIEIDGQKIMTAGITADQLETIKALVANKNEEKVQAKLSSDYKVQSFLDLRSDEAAMFIESLQED